MLMLATSLGKFPVSLSVDTVLEARAEPARDAADAQIASDTWVNRTAGFRRALLHGHLGAPAQRRPECRICAAKAPVGTRDTFA